MGARVTALARLLSRICSVVNSRPQTLQRQAGDELAVIPGAGCRLGAHLARTNSLLHSGHCRWIMAPTAQMVVWTRREL